MPKPKRKCSYQEKYTAEWNFIKKGRFDDEIECKICKCFLNIGHGGRSDINDHIKSKKHKSRMTSSVGGSNPSCSMNNYIVKRGSAEEDNVTAAELTVAYHTIKHHQSFRAADCGNNLFSVVFSDSQVASKFSSARTKTSALIKSVLGPQCVKEAIIDIKQSSCYSIATDASNHKAEKLFPLLVQYFNKETGVESKLIKVSSLKNETAETVSNYCIETIRSFNLNKDSCIAFGGDNCNTNFGGLNRRGTNNIFTKLKEKVNKKIEGVGCPAHILHNTMQTSADILSSDVEVIVVKLFTYFSIYTVRTERLKEFCEFVGTEYRSLMSHSKTRWLSLYPAVNRILEMYDALKSFFLSEEKPPAVILAFFKNPLSEAYLWLVHSQLTLFKNQTLKIEGAKKSIIEVIDILHTTLESIKNRRDAVFMPIIVKSILQRDEVTESMRTNFESEVTEFYNTSFEYLEKWIRSLASFSSFSWMLLQRIPEWTEVEATCVHLMTIRREVDDVKLFDQFAIIKKITEKELKENSETWKNKLAHEKWVYILQQCEFEEQYSEFLRICEFIFSVPAHNANVERIFSLMNIQWTDERNRLELSMVEPILQCLTNYKMSCTEFYKYIVENKRTIFPLARSSEKYKTKEIETARPDSENEMSVEDLP